jgi:hypothetical protein
MNKYYTTEQMIEELDKIIVDDLITSDEVKLFEDVMVRLSTQDQHMNYLQQRIDFAEKVIGELYLMQEECSR